MNEKNPMDDIIGYKLRRAQLSTFHDFIERFKEIDLRPAEFSVLRIIHERPGLRHAEVARMLGIKRTNFVALMDTLERRGFADRRTSGTDRRSHALYLTENGEAFLKTAIDLFDRHEAGLVQKLGGAKARDTLLELLSKLTDGE